VQDYYNAHPEEFKTEDAVTWLDVFIPVGGKHATLAEVRRFGEELLARCKQPGDFRQLLAFNEGPSKLTQGEGLGRKRGEIQPREVEDVLFRLKPGQIGPVIELPTGVHLVQVLQRDNAGMLPFTDQVQKKIRKKLEALHTEQEVRRLVQDLRSRAVVEIVNP
jgi:parvulin-like peptidyl-prolyl isomerase